MGKNRHSRIDVIIVLLIELGRGYVKRVMVQ